SPVAGAAPLLLPAPPPLDPFAPPPLDPAAPPPLDPPPPEPPWLAPPPLVRVGACPPPVPVAPCGGAPLRSPGLGWGAALATRFPPSGETVGLLHLLRSSRLSFLVEPGIWLIWSTPACTRLIGIGE